MKRIALVNQRYGLDVNGGSEYYTRLLAEKLTAIYEVEVLTTKARTYDTWENSYHDDEEILNGVQVLRFPVKRKRKALQQKLSGKVMSVCGWHGKAINRVWVNALGPYVPELLKYIEENSEKYDAFVFITYLYYTTVWGMQQVSKKSVFIPTAHDERYIYFQCYKKLFHIPKAIIYLTEEEREFVHRTFYNESIPHVVAGVGVDLPEDIDEGRFREKYKIDRPFLLYTGRVDAKKGCKEMFQYFARYRKENPGWDLVIMGQAFMKIPDMEGVHYLGFVSESDKFDGLRAARALWLPSEFESLSISVLEAMAMGTPVIVNGRCEVLKGHCIKSNGGVYYTEYREFVEGLQHICGESYGRFCQNAQYYIQKNYTWEKILEKITDMIELP